MRIVIAAVSSNTFMSGVSRHAANIVRCLLTRSEVFGGSHSCGPVGIQAYLRSCLSQGFQATRAFCLAAARHHQQKPLVLLAFAGSCSAA